MTEKALMKCMNLSRGQRQNEHVFNVANQISSLEWSPNGHGNFRHS